MVKKECEGVKVLWRSFVRPLALERRGYHLEMGGSQTCVKRTAL